MIKLVGLLLLLGLVMVGCSSSGPSDISTMPLPVSSSELDPAAEQKLIDSPWISPAVVEVSNFYPGARAEWNLRVHNGKDEESGFSITYKEPNYLREGYSMPPDGAQAWVLIADPSPVFAPKETLEILVVLEMPWNVEMEDKAKWEFWVSVIEDTDSMIRTEMCSRWLVSMR